MDEELDYLWETLGLEITADLWPERDKIHPTLRPAITVVQAKYRRASFLIMRMSWHAGLPDLKRIQASLVKLSGMPTVISEAHLEQRQRERLQQQRIPFICPGVQAYLPFMDEEYWSGKPNKHVKVYDPHEWAQLADCLRQARRRKVRPRFQAQTGPYFPVEPSTGNRVPQSKLRMGRAFRNRPLWESASHSGSEFRVALSAAATATPRPKPIP